MVINERIRLKPMTMSLSPYGTLIFPSTELKSSLRMINLLQMSPDERAKLVDNIASCGHALQIWVHTHDDEGKQGWNEDAADLARYLRVREKMIETSYRSKLPILALIGSRSREENESGKTLANYERYYHSYNRNGSNPTIYYLSTLRDRSTPSIITPEPEKEYSDEFEQRQSDEYTQFENRNWGSFYTMLKEFGVNTVIIRGRNLELKTVPTQCLDKRKKDILVRKFFLKEEADGTIFVKRPEACVGKAFLQLGIRGMDVRLSRVIHTQIAHY